MLSSGACLPFGFADQKPGNPIRHVEKPLRNADINHQHTGHQLRLHAQRRQGFSVACDGYRAFGQIEIGKHLRRDQRFSRRHQERLQIRSADRRRISHFRRQCQRLDAQQSE
jgi:hypothetical protein